MVAEDIADLGLVYHLHGDDGLPQGYSEFNGFQYDDEKTKLCIFDEDVSSASVATVLNTLPKLTVRFDPKGHLIQALRDGVEIWNIHRSTVQTGPGLTFVQQGVCPESSSSSSSSNKCIPERNCLLRGVGLQFDAEGHMVFGQRCGVRDWEIHKPPPGFVGFAEDFMRFKEPEIESRSESSGSVPGSSAGVDCITLTFKETEHRRLYFDNKGHFRHARRMTGCSCSIEAVVGCPDGEYQFVGDGAAECLDLGMTPSPIEEYGCGNLQFTGATHMNRPVPGWEGTVDLGCFGIVTINLWLDQGEKPIECEYFWRMHAESDDGFYGGGELQVTPEVLGVENACCPLFLTGGLTGFGGPGGSCGCVNTPTLTVEVGYNVPFFIP